VLIEFFVGEVGGFLEKADYADGFLRHGDVSNFVRRGFYWE
jgi:hypothetical protein